MTGISWTDKTWNPTTGCQKVSPGCKHCFAEAMHARLHAIGLPKYEQPFGDVVFHSDELSKPLHWRKPCRIFVNSMSDLFHSSVTNEQIAAVYGVMAACQQHTFQVLTKRPERAVEWYAWLEHEARFASELPFPPAWWCAHEAELLGVDVSSAFVNQWPLPNVHLLTSCEDQQRAEERIPRLRQCPAAVHGISFEPLLGPICVDLTGIGWVICGAESGPGRRPCEVEWILDLARQCKEAGVPFFNKQMSIGGKVVKDMAQFPVEARARMFPRDRWE